MTVVQAATSIQGGSVPILNTSTGIVSVPVGTPPGIYTITYQICDKVNPTFCQTAVVTIPVALFCNFEVTCPTFEAITVECYDDIPTTTILSEIEFENLGNRDGEIGDTPCGLIEVTAANSAKPSCGGNVIRTYTITEYSDTNNNKIRDLGENTILNIQNCSQTIRILDTIAPVLTSALDTVMNVNCDIIPDIPVIVFSDACSIASEIVVTITETTSGVKTDGTYTIVRSWTASDSCNNQTTVNQTVNVTIPNYIRAITVDEICNIDTDLTVDITKIINKQFPGVISSTGTFIDVSGVGTALSGGVFTPLDLVEGNYIVRYENNDADCPRVIEVTIPVRKDVCLVENCVSLTIHNAFTPDGDGINENFIIDNINNPCYAENTVEIYNRWGVLVFDVQNYNNTDRVFKGFSEGRATVKETSGLPTGTYYYVLKYKNIEGNYASKTGWLYLGRSK